MNAGPDVLQKLISLIASLCEISPSRLRSPTIFAPIGYPDNTLITNGKTPDLNIRITPISCRKLAHMKNGSSAGSTLLSHSDMPFLAEQSAMDGKTTISTQHAEVITPASIIFFLLNLKIPIVHIYYRLRVLCIRCVYSFSSSSSDFDGAGMSSASTCVLYAISLSSSLFAASAELMSSKAFSMLVNISPK